MAVAMVCLLLWMCVGRASLLATVRDLGAPTESDHVVLPPRATTPPSDSRRTSQVRALPATARAPAVGAESESGAASALKGVILFLHGGRWHQYFVRECLPRLDLFLLRCFPYPVHVFHEGISPAARRSIEAAVPHAPRLDFEDVSWVWKRLPDGVSEAALERWMNEGVQVKFARRGYRVMCRFWAGIVWTLPSLDRYDYYWRLDTDSVLTKPVRVDPFVHVFVQRRCQYGFNKLKGENMHVATGIFDVFERWADEAGPAVLSPEARERVRRFALDEATGKYWGPMYYNNFEMGTVALKRSRVYQGFFQYVDSHEPYGIFRHRWGDAPLHTLGVVAALDFSQICNVTQDTVGYRHAAKRPEPMPTGALPACPVNATRLGRSGSR